MHVNKIILLLLVLAGMAKAQNGSDWAATHPRPTELPTPTLYRGLMVGEHVTQQLLTKSGCGYGDDWSAPIDKAIERIGLHRSENECIVVLGSNQVIDKILVFAKVPYSREYAWITRNYGPPLPGRYAQLSQDATCCNLWKKEDGTQIWLKPDTLTNRATGEVTFYNIVTFEK